MVDFIDDKKNDEDEGKFESSSYKKRRGGIGRTEKGGDFNEELEFFLRDISSTSQRTNKSLAWDFYEPYEEDGKETDLEWYFCNFCYAKKPDNMKEGMTCMILYNKSKTCSFKIHVVNAHKRFFKTLFLTWMGDHFR